MIYKCTISDTGIGMAESYIEHIFEPFSQEHNDEQSVYHGTGLGMPIVKSLVEKMNGTISISSKEKEGSTFVVTLPFDIANAEEVYQANCDEAEADITGMRILLVEDNELNMEIAGYLLKDAGAEADYAQNGLQAVQMFESKPAGTYDIILMDVMMPQMDGLEEGLDVSIYANPDYSWQQMREIRLVIVEQTRRQHLRIFHRCC